MPEEGRPPELRATRKSLPIALLRARETVMAPIRRMLAETGLSEQQWRVLRVLDESGPMDLTALSREACLMLSSLTRMVRRMAADGLVQRRGADGDRRRVIVAIAEPGRQVIRDHAAESVAILRRVEAAYGADRLAELLEMLEALQSLDTGAWGRARTDSAPSAHSPPREVS